MNEVPHAWQILKVTSSNPVVFKVLAGWNGGYMDGASWRLNSGVLSYDMDEHYVYFKGYSGSLYQCSLQCEGMNSIMSQQYNWIQDMLKDTNNEISAISLKEFVEQFKGISDESAS